jgi:transposase-like protein
MSNSRMGKTKMSNINHTKPDNTKISSVNHTKPNDTKIYNNDKTIGGGNTVVMKCPYCGNERVLKNGNKYNKQRYLCKDCHKSFSIIDGRVKRDIKERELCLLLYSHNMSLRSIQSVLCKFYGFNISFNLILRWVKSFSKMLSYDINREEKEKPRTINILELDELYSYFYDIKKNEKNISKYGLLLIGTEIKLLHLK